MDQKLLNALNNLSDGLEAIAEALKDKKGNKSATADALQGGNFISEIKEINVGVKQLIKDSKQILKNQETIISLSKKASGDKKSEFEKAGGDKKKESEMKKGIGTILLIAVAVLAIGMAFKLVGGINFLSVIGLSFAILLLAKAFEKVAAMKMSLKEAAIVSASLVLMAVGLTVSSWILKKITPIGITQALTMILIGVGFSMLSPAIGKIIKAFKNMSWMSVAKAAVGLVLVLPAIALGITLSSWILKKVTPIGFAQAITAILIAAVFSVVSFGIKNMLKAFKGIGGASLAMAVIGIPLILPAVSAAIWLSSLVLGKVRPIGFAQAITSILIAAVFSVAAFGINKILTAFKGLNPATMAIAVVALPLLLPAMAAGIWLSSIALSKVQMISFGQFLVSLGISILFIVFAVALKMMAPIIKKLKWEDVIKLPLLMTTMAIAVWASSHILKKTADISFMLMIKILVFSVIFAIAVIVLAAVAWVIGKYFGVKNVLKGAVAIVALAAVIMLSSWLISKGKYQKYPDWKWSLFSGLAIVVFGAIGWVLMKIGSISTYIKGGIAILAVATTIMAASHILAVGNYKKYPKLSWAIGVAASIAAFGVAAALLGPMVFGPQALVFGAGLLAVLGVAATIMAASHILAEGKYTKYPTLGWSMGVALSLAAFTTGMVLLGGMIVASFGIGALALEAGSEAVLGVAQTIVDASYILAKGKWGKGPTVAWSSGVAIALGAFSPIYKMLMNNAPGLFTKGGGVGPDDFAKAIVTVTRGIITAANEFASPKNKNIWKNGPTKAWATGVGIALGAFAPVYGMLMNNAAMKAVTGKGGVGPEDFSKAILTVTKGIITAAEEFARNTAPFKEGMYPSKQWGEGVGAALNAFAPVFRALSEDTGWFTSGDDVINGMVNGVLRMASAIVGVALMFSQDGLKWDSYPSQDWAKNIKSSVLSYIDTAKSIDSMEVDWMTLSNMDNLVRKLTTTARLFGINEKYFNTKINPNFMRSISSNLFYYMAVAERLKSKQGGIGSMLKGALMGDPITNIANGMVQLAKAYDRLAISLNKLGASMKGIDDKKISQMERMSRIRVKTESKGFFGAIGDAIGSAFGGGSAAAVSAPAMAPPSSSPGGKKEAKPKVGKYGDIHKQNDMIIELLMELNGKLGPGSSIDSVMQKKLTEKKDSNLQ